MAAVAPERRAAADIAVAGLWRRRRNAEGDDVTRCGGLPRGDTGGMKDRLVENDVIGGEREHDRIGIAPERELGAGGDGGSGIAPHRLEHDRRVNPDLLGLRPREEPEIVGRHHDRRREQIRRAHAGERLLIGRALAHQRQKLLGHRIARHRP